MLFMVITAIGTFHLMGQIDGPSPLSEKRMDECVEKNSEHAGDEVYNNFIGCPMGGIMAAMMIMTLAAMPAAVVVFGGGRLYDKTRKLLQEDED